MNKIEIGQKIEEFDVIRQIATGGIGDIYLLFNSVTQKTAALKVLKLDCLKLADYFLEGIDIAKVLGTNTFFPKFYSCGVLSDNVLDTSSYPMDEGIYYLLMEYIEGQTLRALCDKPYFAKNDCVTALKIMHRCAQAYELMHKKGIVHCDVKPQNIMVVGNDNMQPIDNMRLVVFDFDFSFIGNHQIISGKEVLVDSYGKRIEKGTLFYQAPETLNASLGQGATQYSDIWGLGCIYYLILSGNQPFFSSNINRIRNIILNIQHTSLAKLGIDIRLSDLVDSCLEKKWYNRPTATELRKGIESVM